MEAFTPQPPTDYAPQPPSRPAAARGNLRARVERRARRQSASGREALAALRRPVQFACIALLAFATGCTSLREYVSNGLKVGPNYRRPPAPVAQQWIDEGDRRIHNTESEDFCHWWTVFNDPVLSELVADAYRQNLTLREAGFRILQNRALLGIAVGGFFPQQQYASGDHTANSISTQAANRIFVLEQYFPQWDFGFTLNWELDFWGRYRRAIAAADDRLDASVEDYDAAIVTLLGDVAQAYVQMRIYEQQIALTQANINLQKETLKIATARFRGGLVTELDVDQAQSILSQTEAQIPQFEISLRQTNNRLCVLLGIPAEDLERRMARRSIPTVPPEVAIGVPADLVRRRPDVRRAERNAAAQAEEIGIAESEFYPHLGLNGTFSYSAREFQGLFHQSALYGTWGPAFQWNLLNYGRILNNVRAQDALFQELVAHYQQTVLTASAEVESGLVAFLKSQVQTRFMAESVAAAEKAVTIAIAQYRGGLVDFNRVSLVEQNLVQQQNLYAQAFGSIALGLVNTYRALGGGWQIRLDPSIVAAPGLPPPGVLRQPEAVPAPMFTPPAAPAPQPVRPAVPPLPEPPPAELPPAFPAPANPAAGIPAGPILRAPPSSTAGLAPGQASPATFLQPAFVPVMAPPAVGAVPSTPQLSSPAHTESQPSPILSDRFWVGATALPVQ